MKMQMKMLVKQRTCDGCGKLRRDIQNVGGEDGIGLCFICRREDMKGRTFHGPTGRYLNMAQWQALAQAR